MLLHKCLESPWTIQLRNRSPMQLFTYGVVTADDSRDDLLLNEIDFYGIDSDVMMRTMPQLKSQKHGYH